ncbi:unnamed protein product [Durusdinium trenchii]|uniref:Kinesin motor domain-containing protein n=1 Tax=Durusdinium trenchii TaxID=1381693 RepID=A0ABP0P102_9DINO
MEGWSEACRGSASEERMDWLPLVRLPAFRRCNQSCYRSVVALLASDAALREDPAAVPELEEALSTALAQVDKRVWVGIRLRPHDRHDGAENCLQVDRRQIVQTLGPASRVNFFFDEIFKEDTRHCCLFAYGQTGSGKTHTVFGDPSTESSKGVAFRALGHEETEYVSATMVHECEREELEPGSAYKAPILSAEERVVVRGLTRRRCDPGQLTQQVGSWLVEGAASRMVGKTVFNPRSSRSHAVATIHICWNDMPDQKKGNETRVYIVDLAGSERSGQYATNTEQLREGAHINLSLSTLGRVVTALSRGHGDHVPHRDSALTWLLTDAITGHQARAFMIASVNPLHSAETLSTLRYAQAYSSLQSDLSTKIPRLKAMLRTLQRQMEKARYELDSLCLDINTNSRRGS